MWLVASTALAVCLQAQAAAQSNPPASGSPRDIIVRGQRPPDPLAGIVPDDELDEDDIAAYGLDTIGELIEQIEGEVAGGGDGPVVLINGRPALDLSEVSDLPVEAIAGIQVFSGNAASALAERGTRRVINVQIKQDHTQVTANANGGLSTKGEGFEGEGSLNLLKLAGGDRQSLVFRYSRTDPLFESERDIIAEVNAIPAGFAGNVVAFPPSGGEIDPALSVLAGRPVILAGVPGGAGRPSLAQFAALADTPDIADVGQFRTLVAARDLFSLNGNLTRKFGPSTTLSFNARSEWYTIDSLNGIGSALVRVPAGSAFSPFTRDVAVSRLFGGPLRQTTDLANIDFGSILNGERGKWRYSASVNFAHRIARTQNDRAFDNATLEPLIAAGQLDPFSADSAAVLPPLQVDRSRSRSDRGSAELYLSGPLGTLPAGALRLSSRVGFRADRFVARREAGQLVRNSGFRREEGFIRSSLQVPVIAGGSLGSLGLDIRVALREISAIGTLYEFGSGINWDPAAFLQVRAAFDRERFPPSPGYLTDPTVVTEDFRAYDFLRGETVLVDYITGGNPNLPVERRDTTRAAITVRPFDFDFSITSEYARVRSRGAITPLPPVSVEVQAAFPDRFLRDATGRLVSIDARSVAFAREKQDQLRTTLSFSRDLGGSSSVAAGLPSRGETVRVNGTLTHLWLIEQSRLVRVGLPEIDLLDGGASGYGGGGTEHLLEFDVGLLYRGLGLRVSGSQRSGSEILAGPGFEQNDVFFAPRTIIDLHAFANLGPQFRAAQWAEGMRVTFKVENLFGSEQRVRDRAGLTPLRYQPDLLDPIGRRITLGLRKAF